jgi:replicative DNA helicase
MSLQAEIERGLINSLLAWSADDALPRRVHDLRSEHFSDLDCSVCWQAIGKLLGNSAELDILTIRQALIKLGHKDRGAWLANLACEQLTSTNLERWAEIVYTEGRKRVLLSRLNRIAHSAGRAKGPDDNLEEILVEVEQAAQEARKASDHGYLQHVSHKISETLTQLEAEASGNHHRALVKTGIRQVDQILQMQTSSLTVLAGRPSMGKSAFAVSIALHNARDNTQGAVAYFSLEMSTIALLKRMMQHEARAGIDDLLSYARDGSIVDVASVLYQHNLYVDERPKLSAEDIHATLSEHENIRLVIVDYLQLLKQPKADRHDLSVGMTTRAIRSIAKDFNCHVILLSQLNRQLEQRSDKRPLLSDLRDSGEIEQDADNVVFLHRPEYYKPDDRPGIATVIIAKQRHGPIGIADTKWIGAQQRFS